MRRVDLVEKIVFGVLLGSITGTAALVDIRKREIPDAIPICLVLIGFIKLLLSGLSLITMANAAIGALVSGLPLLFAAVKSGGIGGGDVKLATSGGLFLGLIGSCSALLFSLLLFLLFSLLYICVKGLNWKTSLPFAPFYAIASMTVYFIPLILKQ